MEITKMRLALSVVFSSVAGYFLAADTINYFDLVLLATGGYCLVGASNAFNQVIEKDLDSLMQRTKNRPLPSGRMRPVTALTLAVAMTVIGIGLLYLLNWRTAFFGSIYVGLGCLHQLFWHRTRRAFYAPVFLAIPSFLGHCLDAR